MRTKLNKNLLLWALSVLQPASPRDVRSFISLIYPEIRPLPRIEDIEDIFSDWIGDGYLQQVHGKLGLYSATSKASLKLSVKLKRSRDKARLYLLKATRTANLKQSGGREQDLDGVSPPVEDSGISQEGAWPIKPAAAPLVPRTTGRFYWPRISKQLNIEVGPGFSPPDTFLNYYSFSTLKSIHSASNNPAPHNDLSITDISLAIGISPRLITSFLHAPNSHYRRFTVGKRGGGVRLINSPRTFLKVVQYWILDYFLYSLPCHQSCHSYQKGKSILSNAVPHVNQKYVANIDILNFFPSITTSMVFSLLRENNFGSQLSKTISRIATLDSCLPQGAPTSPCISNAVLHDFDEAITNEAISRNIIYTRYADDMSISGANKENVTSLIKMVSLHLKKMGMSINDKKTRIASRGGQQKVTGVVVNEVAQPPRSYRRRIRAMFHHAGIEPNLYIDKISTLKGHISYLESFPTISGNTEIVKYKDICRIIQLLISTQTGV